MLLCRMFLPMQCRSGQPFQRKRVLVRGPVRSTKIVFGSSNSSFCEGLEDCYCLVHLAVIGMCVGDVAHNIFGRAGQPWVNSFHSFCTLCGFEKVMFATALAEHVTITQTVVRQRVALGGSFPIPSNCVVVGLCQPVAITECLAKKMLGPSMSFLGTLFQCSDGAHD